MCVCVCVCARVCVCDLFLNHQLCRKFVQAQWNFACDIFTSKCRFLTYTATFCGNCVIYVFVCVCVLIYVYCACVHAGSGDQVQRQPALRHHCHHHHNSERSGQSSQGPSTGDNHHPVSVSVSALDGIKVFRKSTCAPS